MSDSDSTPPARMVSAWPSAIWSAALVMAWARGGAGAVQRVGGDAGGGTGGGGSPRAPTLGVSTEGTTWPKMTSSISRPSISLR